ncbi:MAG TPA: rhodanese-like domain-containing protein [Pyrinomonadaceae bacterium]|nr:rhodanese-like domain-containing protein [Pyrinomonadaceae bacterium]
MSDQKIQIITFYEFKKLENLSEIKAKLKSAMDEFSIKGTILIAAEGYNSTISGLPEDIDKFVEILEETFETKLKYKTSYFAERPFLKAKVRIKQEIVSLRHPIKIEKGIGTHTKSADWNKIISEKDTIILDTRNDYEVEIGTFKGAINPKIEKFSDLTNFVKENFDPQQHKNIAMFCTGGIRCEKFAPLMVEFGFENVYQLEGGILKYLEETPEEESLWEGECFVFDDRIAVDKNLEGGKTIDNRPLTVNPPQKKNK